MKSPSRSLDQFSALTVNVIGDSLVDLNFGLPKEFIHRFGHGAKIELPFGDKLSLAGYDLMPGGSGANVSLGLATAGFSVNFQTGLAPDVFGTYLKETLPKERLELVVGKHGSQTPLSVVLRVGGERTIITGRSSGSYLPASLPKRGWLHLGPLHGQLDAFCTDVTSHQIKTGQMISCNPSIESLESRERGLMSLLKTTTILVVNLHEAWMATRLPQRTTPPALVQALSRLGPKIVCLTDGERGAYVGTSELILHAPALADRQVRVDATGAGDAFTTGFLTGYLSGLEDLEPVALLGQALAFATVNAASVVGSVGGQGGLLTAAEMAQDSSRVKIKRVE